MHVDANPASKTYGDADPTPTDTLRASDFQGSDTATNSGITGSASCTIATHSATAGSHTGVITCAPGSLASTNYTFVTGNNADLTIGKATVHVDANPASKTAGQPDPAPSDTLRASDFHGSDTAANSGITGAASCTIGSHAENDRQLPGVVTCGPGTLAAATTRSPRATPRP